MSSWAVATARAREVHGPVDGWPAEAARTLLALLLYVSGHERGTDVSEVPWSAIRVRLLFDENSLRTYLPGTLAEILAGPDETGLDETGPAAAWRHLQQRHSYAPLDTTDFSSPGGPDPRDYLSHGYPIAVTMVDEVLLAERGGWSAGTKVSVTMPFSGRAETGEVLAPIWDPALPDPADEGLIDALLDLVDGPPAGYTVRVLYGHEFPIASASITVLP